MGSIGISVFLLAVGAILAFAVDVTVSGVDLDTVGVILMVVGAVGVLAAMIFAGSMPWRGDREVVTERHRERI
ncbi:MAG: DUF6458 family protein [Acidimicrobiales bacterium]